MAKRGVGIVFFVLSAIVVATFVFYLFADSESIDLVGVSEIPAIAALVALFLVLVAILFLVLLMAGRRRARAREEPEPRPEAFYEEEPQEPATIPVAVSETETVDAEVVPPTQQFLPPEPEPAPAPKPAVGANDLGGGLRAFELAEMDVHRRAWGSPERRDGATVHPYHFPQHMPAGVYVNDYIATGARSQLKLRTLLAGPKDLPDARRRAAVRPVARAPASSTRSGPELATLPAADTKSPVAGDAFVKELEQRFAARKDAAAAPTPAPRAEVYFDFTGDVHPVEDIEGIGPTYGERLRGLGVHTTARLCYEDTASLAKRLGVPEKTVQSWKSMAELVKVTGIGPQFAEALVRAGITGIDELKRRSPDAIASQVGAYLSGLGSTVLGQSVTAPRVAGWQEAARSMRRLRQEVPAQ